MMRVFQENPKLERIKNRMFKVHEYHWLRPVRYTEDFDTEIMKRVVDGGTQNSNQKKLVNSLISKKKSLRKIDTNDWKKVIGYEDTGKLPKDNIAFSMHWYLYIYFFILYFFILYMYFYIVLS